MKWKRKMPEDYFLLVNLSLVSRMELFDIIYHLLKLNKVSYHGNLHALFTIYPGWALAGFRKIWPRKSTSHFSEIKSFILHDNKSKFLCCGVFYCFQCYRTKTPKQRFLEKHQKVKVKKVHKKTAEGKRGSLLTPATSSINYNPWSRRYVGEGGRIPIVGNRRESLIGKIYISIRF